MTPHSSLSSGLLSCCSLQGCMRFKGWSLSLCSDIQAKGSLCIKDFEVTTPPWARLLSIVASF